jgi:hypothetical protein
MEVVHPYMAFEGRTVSYTVSGQAPKAVENIGKVFASSRKKSNSTIQSNAVFVFSRR